MVSGKPRAGLMRVDSMVPMSDERRAGAIPAIRSSETMYRQEFAAVLALAYVLSGSRSAAEELAQEAFLAAHRRWDAISQYDDPAGWVRRVCANRSTSLIRRRVSEAKALTRLAGRRVVPGELPPDDAAFGLTCGSCPSARARSSPCTTSTTCPWRRSPPSCSAPKGQ